MDAAQAVKGAFLALIIALGVGDLFGLLPPSLNLANDAFAYLMLSLLWYELNVPLIVFGSSSRRMNLAFVLILYVLAAKHVAFTANSYDMGKGILASWGDRLGLMPDDELLRYGNASSLAPGAEAQSPFFGVDGRAHYASRLVGEYANATAVTFVGAFEKGADGVSFSNLATVELAPQAGGPPATLALERVTVGKVECRDFSLVNLSVMVPRSPVRLDVQMDEALERSELVALAKAELAEDMVNWLDRWSMALGFALLALYSLAVAVGVELTGSSFAYSIFVLATGKLSFIRPFDMARLWQLVSASFDAEPGPRRLALVGVRFIAFYYTLLGFFVFVFDTVTQWLVVSIEKSLYAVALLYAVSYLRRLDIGSLKRLNDVDEALVAVLASMFTRSRLVYLGLAALLITHAIADVGYFIIPSLLGGMETRMVDVDPDLWAARHGSPWALARADTAGLGAADTALIWSMYVLGSFALLFFMLMPVLVFLLMCVREMGGAPLWKHWLSTRLLLALFLASALAQLLAPWSSMQLLREREVVRTLFGLQVALPQIGAVAGVDFPSSAIGGYVFTWEAVPESGSDAWRLRHYLKDRLGAGWAGSAWLSKSADGRRILLSSDSGRAVLELGGDGASATARSSDGAAGELVARRGAGGTALYDGAPRSGLFAALLALSGLILVAVFVLWSRPMLRNLILSGAFVMAMLFFSTYILLFSASMTLYFTQRIFSDASLLMVKLFGDLMLVTVAFYAASLAVFVAGAGEWFAATALDIYRDDIPRLLASVTLAVMALMAVVVWRQGPLWGGLAALTVLMVHLSLAWGLGKRMGASASQPGPAAAQGAWGQQAAHQA